MTQVTPHLEELADALRQIEPPPAIPDDNFPVVVDRKATTDIDEDYLDPEFIVKLREGGTHTPAYRTYLRWRRTMVARLSANRFTQQDIADRLGVSVYTVAQDVKAIRALYENIATRDWAVLVEERIMQLDVDIMELRRLMNALPQLSAETEDGTVLIGPDVDQRLRIFDRIMSLEARRDKLLGIDQAASRQHVETKQVEVKLSWNEPAAMTNVYVPNDVPDAIDAEVVDGDS